MEKAHELSMARLTGKVRFADNPPKTRTRTFRDVSMSELACWRQLGVKSGLALSNSLHDLARPSNLHCEIYRR
jgi:hypothetical protein